MSTLVHRSKGGFNYCESFNMLRLYLSAEDIHTCNITKHAILCSFITSVDVELRHVLPQLLYLPHHFSLCTNPLLYSPEAST